MSEENPTAQDLLMDAMFSTLKSVIIVAVDSEDSVAVWHSAKSSLYLAGMLEAAKLQVLGVAADEDEEE